VPGASVRVTDADTNALVTIKPNRDGSGTLANPFTADADGFAQFYVAAGRYDIRVTQAGDVRTWSDVVLLADAATEATAPGYLLDVPAAGVTHDYTPSLWPTVGFPSRMILELQPGSGAASIGGLDPTNVPDGAEVIVTCKHANGITLLAEDATATASWRIQAAFDLGLPNGAACRLIRSSTISRWILLP
jgi:hypothetical protein